MKRMIVVEDDQDISNVIVLTFRRINIEVISYGSGEVIMEGNYPTADIFLLDKQLPGVDGLDICRYLKSNETTSHIPVVMMSANLRIAELAGDAGADDVIMKPFNIKALQGMILEHLGEVSPS